MNHLFYNCLCILGDDVCSIRGVLFKNIEGEEIEMEENYWKDYYKNNKERIQQQQKEYREQNKEQILAYAKGWREENGDYFRNYVKNNRDHINEKQREYYKNGKSSYCYVMFNKDLEIIRVGSCSHLNRIKRYKCSGEVPLEEIYHIVYVETPSRESAYYMEGKLIEYYNPIYNDNDVDIEKYRGYEHEIVNLEDLNLNSFYL